MPGLTTFGWMTLTELVNKIVAPKTFVLDKLFAPRTRQHLTKSIQVDLKIGNRKLAPFVKRTQGATVIELNSKTSQFFETPRIRLKKQLSASDLLFVRAEGFPTYLGNGQTIATAREQKVAEELQDLKDMTTRRLEWMACQALTGAITVTQDDLEFKIDFLMPGANKPALQGNALWSAVATADPLANIRAWKLVVQNARGIVPTMAIARHEVINLLLQNTKVKEILNLRNLSVGSLNTNAQLSPLGVTFIGNLEGVDIYEYNESYVSPQGVVTPMIPDDRFVLVSPSADNRLHYGAIEDLDAQQNIAMAFFSKDWIEKDPSAYWLLTESSPLTVPHEPETIVCAKVR